MIAMIRVMEIMMNMMVHDNEVWGDADNDDYDTL